jgi:uncharacterized protein with von Willebrand factor type A (vWA) domain
MCAKQGASVMSENGNNSLMENRDYTLIIDTSGSMATKDEKGGKSRWAAMQESTFALACKCEQFDPDGITVYMFSTEFKRYDDVTASKVTEIFKENDPFGSTDLASVLKHATDSYFERKDKGESKPNGETILVVTDGAPDDREAVKQVIIDASKKIGRDEELAISLIQIGTDQEATEFLKELDDKLKDAETTFDICDTVTMKDIEEKKMRLNDVLLNAILD